MATHAHGPRPRSTDIGKLSQLRDHHLNEARRIDDAIDLLRTVNKLTAKADRIAGKVRARAESESEPPIRGSARPAKHPRDNKARYERAKQLTDTGERPIDQVRRAFVAAGGKVMSAADLLAITGLEGKVAGPANLGARGNANRTIGIALNVLVKSKEIKGSKERGYIARKIVLPDMNHHASASPAHP